MSEALALELAPYNIRVNSISPGIIDTSMVDPIRTLPKTMEGILDRILLYRMGKPEEVDNLVCFLASDTSPYMTGSNVVIDGAFLSV